MSVEKNPVQEDIPTNDQQECPDITTEETIDEKEAEDGLEDTQSDDGSTSSGYNSEKSDLDAKVESPSTESPTSEIEATCSDKAKQETVTEAVETVFERAQARRIQKQENFKEYESNVQFSQWQLDKVKEILQEVDELSTCSHCGEADFDMSVCSGCHVARFCEADDCRKSFKEDHLLNGKQCKDKTDDQFGRLVEKCHNYMISRLLV